MNQSSLVVDNPGGPTSTTTTPLFIPVGPEWVQQTRIFAGVVTPLVTISIALLIMRIFTRVRSASRLQADDWLISLAAVSEHRNMVLVDLS